MYYQIYFSPTGNTKKAIEYFCDEENIAIDLCKRGLEKVELKEGDIAYIGVPSYSGRCPGLAIERLKKVYGNKARAILISSYGNRASEDTLIELSDTLRAQGFNIVAAMELVGRHSIFNKVAVNRPDGVDYKDYASFKLRIKEKLINNKVNDFIIPGNHPYKEVKPSSLFPLTTDSCVGCGDCERYCPAGAISKSDPRIIDPSLCAHCMRCIYICKFNAKHLDEVMYTSMEERLRDKFMDRKPNNLYI